MKLLVYLDSVVVVMKKIYNMRLEDGKPVFEGEQVLIDGVSATYRAVCRKCYKEAMKGRNINTED